MSIPGTQGDGVITLILAVLIALGAGWLWRWPGAHREARTVIALLAIVVLVIGFNDMSGVSEQIASSERGSELLMGSVGTGLYVLLLGGVTALIGVFVYPFQRSERRSAADKLQQDPQRGVDGA